MSTENIHPVFDRIIPREEKEKKLNQNARVLWFTGLSGSGKTSLAVALEKKLWEKGFFCQLLDGDNIRSGINKNLTFSESDRIENVRRIAEISKLFLNCGVICLNCFVSPTIEMRKMAKEIIGEKDFIEIFVNTPVELCEQRDVKGLYAKARQGSIRNFTGIQDGYENPPKPDIEVKTENKSIEQCVEELLNKLLPKINR